MSTCKQQPIYTINLVETMKSKYGISSIKELLTKNKNDKISMNGKELKIQYLENTIGENQKYIADLFDSNFDTVATAQQTLKSNISDRSDVSAKVSTLLNSKDNSIRILNKMLGTSFKGEDAKTIINSAIALKYILEEITTNSEQLTENYNISKNDLDVLFSEGPTAGTARLYPTIGRAILASQGTITFGMPAFSAAQATIVGKEAVDKLVELGIITVSNGKWISGGVVEGRSSLNISKGNLISKTNISDGEVIKFPTNSKFVDTKNNLNLSDGTKSLLSTLKSLSRLLEPYTESVPSKEAEPYNKSIQDLQNVPPSWKNLITTINSFKFTINPSVAPILKVLAQEYKDANKSTPQSVEKFLKEKFNNNDKYLKEIFGIDLNKNEDGPLYADNKRGVELSRVAPLIGFIEHFDELITEKDGAFHFNYFTATNSRLHVFETILNAQSDKQFARQILIATEPTTYSIDIDKPQTHSKIKEYAGLTEAQVLVKRIANDFNITEDEIIGKDKSNENLENLIAALQQTNKNNIFHINTLKKLVDIGLDIKIKGSGKSLTDINPWRILKLIQAIIDVRASINENFEFTGPIKSTYMTEVDATASGLLIKLLQNAHLPKVQELVKRLGYKGAAEQIENELNDAYAIAVEKFEQELEVLNSEDNKAFIKSIDENLDKTKKLTNILAINYRDLLKMPIMTFIYGQSPKNNEIQFGKDATDLIFKKSKEDINKVIEIYLKDTDKLDKEFGELSLIEAKNLRNKLITAIANTSGKYLVNSILNEVYTKDLFQETDSDITKIYEILESQNGTVSIVTPYSRLEAIEEKKEDSVVAKDTIPLSKKKENLFTSKINGKNVDFIANMRSYNPISAKVVPIHAIDAAVLARTINRLKKELNRNFTENEVMLLVHDAIYANSNIASLASQIYEEELIKVNYEYDIVGELLKLVDTTKLNAEQAKLITTIKERNTKNIEDKKTFFNTKDKSEQYLNFSFKTDLNKDIKTYDQRKDLSPVNKDLNVKPSGSAVVMDTTNVSEEAKEALDKLTSVIDSKNYMVYDIETYMLDGGINADTAIPNEIYATKITENGEEVFHGFYVLESKEDQAKHDANVAKKLDENPNNGFRNMNSIKNIKSRNNVVKEYGSKEELKDAFKEFRGKPSGMPIITFNGDGFDNKVIYGENGTENSYDIRTILTDLKSNKLSDAQKNTGTQFQYADALGIKNENAHTADADVNVLHDMAKKLVALNKTIKDTKETVTRLNSIVSNKTTTLSSEAINAGQVVSSENKC